MLRQLLHDWLGSGIWFVHRADNPRLYPAIVVALILVIVVAVGRTLNDVRLSIRDGALRWSRMLRYVIGAGLIVGFSFMGIALTWAGFVTPLDRLAFLPSGRFNEGLSILIHGCLGYGGVVLFVELLVGFCNAEMNSQLFRVCMLLATALAVIGWEVTTFPVAFLVPAELAVVYASAPTLARLAYPSRAYLPRWRRTGDLAIALLFAAVAVVIWRTHQQLFAFDHVGPLRGHGLAVLRVALLASALALVTALLWLVVLPFSRQSVRTLVGAYMPILDITIVSEAVLFVGGGAYLIALSLDTPLDSWPIGPPILTGSLTSTLAHGAYTGSAVVAHGVLAWATITFLAGIVIGRLGLQRVRPARWLLQALALICIAASFEIVHYPLWFVLPSEVFLGLSVAVCLTRATFGNHQLFAVRTPAALRRSERLREAFYSLLVVAVWIYVALAHDIHLEWVTITIVYCGLVALDRVCANIVFTFHVRRTDYRVGSPRRWLATVPAIICLSIVAASGIFDSFTANPSLQPRVWIEIGAASAAYMLFKPLTDLAAFLLRRSPVQPSPETLINALVDQLGVYLDRRALVPQNSNAETKPRNREDDGQVRRDLPNDAPTVGTLLGQSVSRIRSLLKFNSGVIFLLGVLCYDYLTVSFHFAGVLNTSLVPVVFSLTAVIAGLLQLFTSPEMEYPRSISLVLLFVIIVVTGANLLFTVTPSMHLTIPPSGTSPGALLRTPRFYSTSLHLALQVYLFLLTIGQLGYLYQMLDYKISNELGIQLSKDERQKGWDELAELKYNQRKYEEAINAFEHEVSDLRSRDTYDQVGSEDISNAQHWRNMGVAYEYVGRYLEALGAYEQALRIEPGNSQYLRDVGDALEGMDKPAAALAAYETAIAADPTSADAWNGKGNALDVMERYEEAIAAYNVSLQYAPKSALIWRNKGNAYLNMEGHALDALHAFEQAIRFDPQSERTWNGKGRALSALGDHKGALDAFDQALALSPDNPSYFAGRGNALRELGKHKEANEAYKRALVIYQRALKAQPRDDRTWHSMAHFLITLTEFAAALQAIEKALEINPTNGNFWDSKGEILANMERYDEALIAFDQAIALAPEPTSFWVPTSWRAKAKILTAQGRFAEAREAETHARGKSQDSQR